MLRYFYDIVLFYRKALMPRNAKSPIKLEAIPLKVPPDLKAALRAVAKEHERSLNHMITIALREWLAARAPHPAQDT